MINFQIQTERLNIRNLKSSDLEQFHAYRSSPQIALYQGFDPMNKMECQEYIKKQSAQVFGNPGEWIQFAIEDIETKDLIGDCAIKLFGYETKMAELGITLNQKAQHKGYAKETIMGILSFLFGDLLLHRVMTIVDVENIAAIKLLERLKFRKEGHFIENIWFNQKWGSEYQYAMLQSEWKFIRNS
jgi:RimJ/RimL family protein N-acetyltransferase